jgi:hypothetical protein
MRKLKPLLTTLAVTGALAGGGAAIANAATSSTSSTTGTGTTGTTHKTAPMPAAHKGSGSRNCPNM